MSQVWVFQLNVSLGSRSISLRRTYECVTSHIWPSPGTPVTSHFGSVKFESPNSIFLCHDPHTWLSPGTPVNESFRKNQVESPNSMFPCHVTHMKVSWDTRKWVKLESINSIFPWTPAIWLYVAHINVSRHKYDCIYVAHMNASRHTYVWVLGHPETSYFWGFYVHT